MKTVECDFLIVGSGVAGVTAALRLAPHGRTLVLTKKDKAESNTNYAQGGIACVVDGEDSFEDHIQDTLKCGDGLCNEDVVRQIIHGGPDRIYELEELGLVFWKRDPGSDDREYDLGKEGGHSKRRVLHTGDRTGHTLEKTLLAKAAENPDLIVDEHAMVIDLICTGALGVGGRNRCVGAYVLDRIKGEIYAVKSPVVILATGGGGKVYLYTSNPDIATADGMAIAWRAGVPIKNMEFIQFHPTCLFHPEAKSFLISEAVRGEGAELVDQHGQPFMHKYDERGSLAPRDVVARAIDNEMKSTGATNMFLDIRHKGAEYLSSRFKNIYKTCLSFGINMATDLIPVVPAAHYFCGGVEAGVDGVTALPGLYACGEVACTGLHGSNRLASNSLLEALVCSHAMCRTIIQADHADVSEIQLPAWETGGAVSSDEEIVIEHNWHEVRTCMWDYVGIVRSDKRLARAKRRIDNIRSEIRQYYLEYLVTDDILELRNIADVASLIIRSALSRQESRGLHYTLDYPDKLGQAKDTIISDPPGASDSGD
jgi:L-aspartate oxidase